MTSVKAKPTLTPALSHPMGEGEPKGASENSGDLQISEPVRELSPLPSDGRGSA
jgi:hypothetical protein